jgi:hypothetical protein
MKVEYIYAFTLTWRIAKDFKGSFLAGTEKKRRTQSALHCPGRDLIETRP